MANALRDMLDGEEEYIDIDLMIKDKKMEDEEKE